MNLLYMIASLDPNVSNHIRMWATCQGKSARTSWISSSRTCFPDCQWKFEQPELHQIIIWVSWNATHHVRELAARLTGPVQLVTQTLIRGNLLFPHIIWVTFSNFIMILSGRESNTTSEWQAATSTHHATVLWTAPMADWPVPCKASWAGILASHDL